MRYLKIYMSLAVIALLVWLLNDPAKNVLRYQPTGFNNQFHQQPNQSFSDYVKATTTMVAAARSKAHMNNSNAMISNSAPAILLPNPINCPKNKNGKYDNGIVLVHGLLDTPYGMQSFGKNFQRACYVVYVVLLPGHGTAPGDLLKVHFQDWIAATEFGIHKMAETVNHVTVGGFSIGGLLAIQAALTHKSDLKALILFAPALQIKSSLAPFIPFIHSLSLWIPRLQWWEYHGDNLGVRYESLPVNAIYQTYLLMQKVHAELVNTHLALPIFIAQSEEDATIDSMVTLDFFTTETNPQSRLLWFAEDKKPLPVNDTRILRIPSTLMPQKILSMSHLSFLLPITDPIYGLHGIYKDCLYYKENSPEWVECKSGISTYLGETTPQNTDVHIIQRLTFNPFYKMMLSAIQKFL